MKIIALHNNYSADGKPLESGVYFMADSSLAKSGKPWFLPDFAPEFTCHTHIVFRVGRLGKNIARRFALRYIDAVTIGATVTASGINGAFANAFDGAAMIGDFIPVEQIADINNIKATLSFGDTGATCTTNDMVCKIDEIIEYISKYFTLKIGDIIYAGYGDSAKTLAIGQHLTGIVNDTEVLNIKIK